MTSFRPRWTLGCDVDEQAALIDHHLLPHAGHQLVSANDLARGLDQNDQDVQNVTTQAHRYLAVKRKALLGQQSERSELPLLHLFHARS